MTIFVLFVNLCVAAFIVAVVAEISTLLIGSIVYAFDCIERRKDATD